MEVFKSGSKSTMKGVNYQPATDSRANTFDPTVVCKQEEGSLETTIIYVVRHANCIFLPHKTRTYLLQIPGVLDGIKCATLVAGCLLQVVLEQPLSLFMVALATL